MRRWYYIELSSGYGLGEAERICRAMINDPNLADRYRSEFYSKLGQCHVMAATSFANIDKEKMIINLKGAIAAYLDALRIGGKVSNFELSGTLEWLEKPLWRLVHSFGKDAGSLLRYVETFPEEKKEIPPVAVEVFLNAIMSIKPKDREDRGQIRIFCNRIIGKINKQARPTDRFPGLHMLIEPLETIRLELEKIDKEPNG
jgi:hypothetical protein